MTRLPVSSFTMRKLAIALAAFALGVAIHIRNGLFHPHGMLWLTAAVALAVLSLIAPWPRRWTVPWHGRPARADGARTSDTPAPLDTHSLFRDNALVYVLTAILLIQLTIHLLSPPAEAFEPHTPGWRLPIFALCIIGVGAWLVIHLLDLKWLGRHRLMALLTLHFLAGGWVLTQTPEPFIDVYIFQHDAAAALLEGRNPYALTFPNIYGPDAFVYAPQVMEDDRLLFGYPYMPLSLLLAMPGHLLFGDFRWAHLVAATITGLLIGRMRPGPVAPLAAAVFLFTPRIFYVLEMGWTEPQAAMLLAAVVYAMVRQLTSSALQAAARHPERTEGSPPSNSIRAYPTRDPSRSLRMTATRQLEKQSLLAVMVALGLLLAVKQYLVVLLPLTLLLAGRPIDWQRWIRMMIGAGMVALAVTLPLVLWDTAAFVHSAVTLQMHQPFRPDALSYPAWIARAGGPQLPVWIAVAAALAVGVLARRLTAGGFGFPAAAALLLLAFFALNKQAFANYYFLVIAALCTAAAACACRWYGCDYCHPSAAKSLS